MISRPISLTLLEKAATDNGFDLAGGRDGAWLPFASSQTSLRIWLRVLDGSLYIVALSRREVCAALPDLGAPWTNPLPPGACAARCLADAASLHRLIRRAFQISRALPDAPLQVFLECTATLPRTTQAERLIVQRVGQDLFRNGLLDYWEGTCPVSGLAVPELLRASHIKPWAACGRKVPAITEIEMEMVLGTVPILARRQTEGYGEARTRRLVLAGLRTLPRLDAGPFAGPGQTRVS